MLFKAALVLLAACSLGIVGVHTVEELVPVLRLVGMMLLLLALLKAREAAAGHGTGAAF